MAGRKLHSSVGGPSRGSRCSRRLAFEPLEERRMLAILTVNSLLDNTSAGDGLVTLREAIAAANSNTTTDLGHTGSGADTIQFAAGLSGAVNLSTAGDTTNGASALVVTTSITIRGNANGITIQRGVGSAEMRLFRVAATGSLTLESIMLADGVARGVDGITPDENGGMARGGAVFNQGTLEIVASTLYGNAAHGGNGIGGGGGGSGVGGAIYNDGGSVSIVNATFSGNVAQSGTGATVPSSFGGAVYSVNGSVEIYNSTITNNSSTTGRGVFIVADAGTTTADIYSSIIAQADAPDTLFDFVASPDTGGTLVLSGANNLIRRQNDFPEIAISTADPLLGALVNNGGPTPTHAFLAGSPAINQGSNLLSLTTDQRGPTFLRTAGGQADIGAFEVQTIAGPALPGDYNGNQAVDAADYVVWRNTVGASVPMFSGADGSGNGTIDSADYNVWRANFGAMLAAAATASAKVVRTSDELAPVRIVPANFTAFAEPAVSTSVVSRAATAKNFQRFPQPISHDHRGAALLEVLRTWYLPNVGLHQDPAISTCSREAAGAAAAEIEALSIDDAWAEWSSAVALF